MSVQVQLDLFRESKEEDMLKAEIDALKESHHAVRKKLFGQVGALSKLVIDQQEQIDFLKYQLNLASPLR